MKILFVVCLMLTSITANAESTATFKTGTNAVSKGYGISMMGMSVYVSHKFSDLRKIKPEEYTLTHTIEAGFSDPKINWMTIDCNKRIVGYQDMTQATTDLSSFILDQVCYQ